MCTFYFNTEYTAALGGMGNVFRVLESSPKFRSGTNLLLKVSLSTCGMVYYIEKPV